MHVGDRARLSSGSATSIYALLSVREDADCPPPARPRVPFHPFPENRTFGARTARNPAAYPPVLHVKHSQKSVVRIHRLVEVGQQFGPLGWTIMFALTASLMSALTLVPLAFSRYKPVEKKELWINKVLGKMGDVYARFMPHILKHKIYYLC